MFSDKYVRSCQSLRQVETIGVVKMEISFTPDSEGYLSQECPECEKRFKVQFAQGDDEGQPIRFCLYCGHNGENCWWTQEQLDYITANLAHGEVAPQLQAMGKRLERASRGGFIQFKTSVDLDPIPPKPVEPDEPWPTKTFKCCHEPVMHDGTQAEIHCPMCGAGAST